MKLLLIVANDTMQGWPSLGVAYIASYLRKHISFSGTRIWQYIPDNPIEQIGRLSPDVIGMGASAIQFPVANRLAYRIVDGLGVPVFIGGPHISSLPDYLPDCYCAGVVGEGEQTVLELLQLFEQKGLDFASMKRINGLVFHEGSSLIKTPPRRPIVPLDNIPIPARDLIDMEDYVSPDNNVFGKYFGRGTMMFTSRGCPCNCTFCAAKKLWGNIRFHSPEYVVNEMSELIKTYKVQYLNLYDDLFVVDGRRLSAIADLVQKEGIDGQVKFGVQARADLMTEQACRDLKRMGVVQVSMGMESGAERVLRMLKVGTVTTQHIREAVRICRKYGLEVDGTFMIGSPTETKEEMLASLAFIKELRLDKFAHFLSTPYPGTQLWEYAVRTGQIPADPRDVDWSMLRMKESSLEHESGHERQFIFTDTESRETIIGIWNLFEQERVKLFCYRWEDRVKKTAGKRTYR
jgi:radical SAM superfamily enzyme YgiQ (UPF0313 family)